LPEDQNIDIAITDVLGREVSKVFKGNLNAGEHTYTIADKGMLSSGIYIVKVNVDNRSFSKKLIVK
jgi:hypothetical protein